MTPCKSCGEPYQKRTDDKGWELVNIDPTSGLCIPCLSKSISTQARPMVPEAFDARKAAAGKDE